MGYAAGVVSVELLDREHTAKASRSAGSYELLGYSLIPVVRQKEPVNQGLVIS